MSDTAERAAQEQRAKELAERIATEVLYHIDEMYPNMWEGVPNAARLSVRNTILRQDWRVAAALAACAREAETPLLKALIGLRDKHADGTKCWCFRLWQHQRGRHTPWCEAAQKAVDAALERAAGESK